MHHDDLMLRVTLYDDRAGRCDLCTVPIGRSAHVHHRLRRSAGGTDHLPNLALLHPACHEWVHAHPTEATACGLLIPRGTDPTRLPLITHRPDLAYRLDTY